MDRRSSPTRTHVASHMPRSLSRHDADGKGELVLEDLPDHACPKANDTTTMIGSRLQPRNAPSQSPRDSHQVCHHHAGVRGVNSPLPVITQRGAEHSRHHHPACRSTAGFDRRETSTALERSEPRSPLRRRRGTGVGTACDEGRAGWGRVVVRRAFRPLRSRCDRSPRGAAGGCARRVVARAWLASDATHSRVGFGAWEHCV
jgi:hypothetical protein